MPYRICKTIEIENGHMFVKHQGEFTMRTVPAILHDLKKRLDAESAHIDVD